MNNTIIAKSPDLLPTRWTEHSYCLDLRASEFTAIEPWEVKLIPLWIKTNFMCMIYARSSLPIKKGLILANWVWVIDEDFRWELMAQVYNISDYPVTIKKWERIAQLDTKNADYDIIIDDDQYSKWNELEPSFRWEWWFWSTGN